MADASGSDQVLHLFKLANEQEVNINLIFLMDLCQFSSLHGQCVLLKNRHFILRVSLDQLKQTQLVWGADVEGYFGVRTEQDRVPVHFRSKLVRLYNAPPDSMYLILPIPAHVDQGQRRNSRRVELSTDNSQGFDAWYGSLEGGDEEQLPQQIWRPFKASHCQVGELSASGMRLDFRQDDPLMARLQIDTPVLLRGDFGSRNKPLPLFVIGTIVRKMPRKDREGLMSVGCHFLSWRRIGASESEAWFKADDQEGIAQISQWLGRQFK